MARIVSVPHLMAVAHGQDCIGPQKCYYCAAPCDGTYPTSTYLKDSFTGLSGVPCPGSKSVCAGCVLCLREECRIAQLDGTFRDATVAAMRGYSWVITATSAKAGTKAHMDHLRAVCLTPPEPPFAVVLSDSGQKHLLYRGAVNFTRTTARVSLEEEVIEYRPEDLASRLSLCEKLVAATGKPALEEPVGVSFALALSRHFPDGVELTEEWHQVRTEPLSRLAAWLVPNKERCLAKYPIPYPGAGSPPAGGAGEPRPKTGGKRQSRGSRSGDSAGVSAGPSLF